MALSQVETTASKARKQLYIKHYDQYRRYFTDFLGSDPTPIAKVEALVDARYIRGIYSVVKGFPASEMATLTPEESRATREAALQDVLTEIKVNQSLRDMEKRLRSLVRKDT
jgi:hypothetical protein